MSLSEIIPLSVWFWELDLAESLINKSAKMHK